jgi:hypothetical protein
MKVMSNVIKDRTNMSELALNPHYLGLKSGLISAPGQTGISLLMQFMR